MSEVREVLAWITLLGGTAFSIVGVLGLLRFPDVYTRLHAVGKVGVFGVSILLVAAVLAYPAWFGRAAVLVFFLTLAGPVLGHAIGRAARRSQD